MRTKLNHCFALVVVGFISVRATVHAQVSVYSVTKTASYDQTSDSTPVLTQGQNHFFEAYVEGDGSTDIDSAILQVPPLGQQIEMAPFLAVFQGFTSQTALDQMFGNGTYGFQVTTVDLDFFFGQLSLTGNQYPTIPQFLNFASLQSINASADLTLQWVPFQNGTANDYIWITLDGSTGTVFDSDNSGGLDGTATSVVVPAGTLKPGESYDAYMHFSRFTDLQSSGALGFAVYARETYSTIKTSGGATVVVNITGASMAANKDFQVQVSGTPNATFVLEGTTNFGGWTQIDTITPATGSGTLVDTGTASNPHRFYRVKGM